MYLLIRASKVMGAGVRLKCEEILPRGRQRSALVKKNRCISIFFMAISFMKHLALLQKLNIKTIPGPPVRQQGLSQALMELERLFTRKPGWVDLIIIINLMSTLKIVLFFMELIRKLK